MHGACSHPNDGRRSRPHISSTFGHIRHRSQGQPSARRYNRYMISSRAIAMDEPKDW